MSPYYFYTDHMTVGYQGVPLIEKIKIQLNKGEILTLVGPNGAGKSTIMKSISGQLDLIGGAVYLDQNNFFSLGRQERSQKMAVVLTEKIRGEMMTCEDVVATGRYPYTGRFGILSEKDHQEVREVMDLVHVTEIKDCDFTRISDGQRQRVMLARAICQEPDLILLDEPTSFLDIKYKLEFLSILQDLKRQKQLTVIMSLHELDLAQRISDRVLCIRNHMVEKEGTPEEVFTPGYIRELFGIEAGSFDEQTGVPELAAPQGKPEVFIIAGGGSGRNVYRRLQRQGIPFATGILFENDLDSPVAQALASRVVKVPAFEEIGEAEFRQARELMMECRHVICCRDHFGVWDRKNGELLELARRENKLSSPIFF
ncbi:MAG: ABC transporter ATP-binding protein [Clostridiales bacterium]|nr:ABC transporter ATP-binding protein [Clostridiales bacterium]